MNSPDPGSPISTDSSGSPAPDDFQFSAHAQQQVLNMANAQLLNSIASFGPNTGSSKRRLPGGSAFSDGSSRRDAKSRRREDAVGMASGPRRLGEGQSFQFTENAAVGSTSYQTRGDYSRQNKEELVDPSLVEQLRQDFGDPFLETALRALG
ncbi:hypothetical protein F5I97DRAFT_1810405 [Phlebopus sp. FC_14]|nr:hypothetical protein F5I97DRAFT_1810405 [Phlebopus sp. FC_14]